MSSAGVSIQPGLSMFTRTRWRMSVKAMLRVAATSAIFDAEYGKRLGAPPWRATEPISTIEPSTVSRTMSLADSWATRQAARTLRAIISSHMAAVESTPTREGRCSS